MLSCSSRAQKSILGTLGWKQNVGRAAFLPEALGENLSLCPLCFQGPPAPSALGALPSSSKPVMLLHLSLSFFHSHISFLLFSTFCHFRTLVITLSTPRSSRIIPLFSSQLICNLIPSMTFLYHIVQPIHRVPGLRCGHLGVGDPLFCLPHCLRLSSALSLRSGTTLTVITKNNPWHGLHI